MRMNMTAKEIKTQLTNISKSADFSCNLTKIKVASFDCGQAFRFAITNPEQGHLWKMKTSDPFFPLMLEEDANNENEKTE